MGANANDWRNRRAQTPTPKTNPYGSVTLSNRRTNPTPSRRTHSDARENAFVRQQETRIGSPWETDYLQDRDDQAMYNAMFGIQDQLNNQTTTSGGSGRSHRSGGYGGGGAGTAAKKKAGQTRIDTLMGIINSQAMKSPQQEFTPDTAMRAQVGEAALADEAIRNREFDALDEYVASLGNAYSEAPQAMAADTSGGVDLAHLLDSQGAGSGTLAAEAEMLQAQGQQQADIQNRLNRRLASGQDAWNQSTASEAKMGRAHAAERASAYQRGLESQITAMDAKDRKRIVDQNFQMKLADRQNLMKMIAEISGIAADSGIDSPDLDIDALMRGMGY